MDKGTNQKSGNIRLTPFHNDDPINDQIEITVKILVSLQPKSPLHFVVYPVL